MKRSGKVSNNCVLWTSFWAVEENDKCQAWVMAVDNTAAHMSWHNWNIQSIQAFTTILAQPHSIMPHHQSLSTPFCARVTQLCQCMRGIIHILLDVFSSLCHWCQSSTISTFESFLEQDGFTYERSAISAWLEKHDTSPLTTETLSSRKLRPNHLAKQVISAISDGTHNL